eukprot:gene3219-33875_t
MAVHEEEEETECRDDEAVLATITPMLSKCETILIYNLGNCDPNGPAVQIGREVGVAQDEIDKAFASCPLTCGMCNASNDDAPRGGQEGTAAPRIRGSAAADGGGASVLGDGRRYVYAASDRMPLRDLAECRNPDA